MTDLKKLRVSWDGRSSSTSKISKTFDVSLLFPSLSITPPFLYLSALAVLIFLTPPFGHLSLFSPFSLFFVRFLVLVLAFLAAYNVVLVEETRFLYSSEAMTLSEPRNSSDASSGDFSESSCTYTDSGNNSNTTCTTSSSSISTNCKVALRVRPLTSEERSITSEYSIQCEPTGFELSIPAIGKVFPFDCVLGPEASQLEMYESSAAELLESVFEGYNATILAYGQTGSGKTHTMGSASYIRRSTEDAGILPRVIHRVHEKIVELEKAENVKFSISCSFLEIYNEEIRDLLEPENFSSSHFNTLSGRCGGGAAKPIRITEDPTTHQISVIGVRNEKVNSVEEMLACLDQGSVSRSTASTTMNSMSSRSHAIFTITLLRKVLPSESRTIRNNNYNGNSSNITNQETSSSNGSISASTSDTAAATPKSSSCANFSDFSGTSGNNCSSSSSSSCVTTTDNNSSQGVDTFSSSSSFSSSTSSSKTSASANASKNDSVADALELIDCRLSKFHFVDLAGSERVKRTQATGGRLKEGIHINGGLLALGNVIFALTEERSVGAGPPHIPYRDSKLTRILQDSLGGNSKTLMIACVSGAQSDFAETYNTVKYATRARSIKNTPVINRDPNAAVVESLKQQVHDLSQQLLISKRNNLGRQGMPWERVGNFPACRDGRERNEKGGLTLRKLEKKVAASPLQVVPLKTEQNEAHTNEMEVSTKFETFQRMLEEKGIETTDAEVLENEKQCVRNDLEEEVRQLREEIQTLQKNNSHYQEKLKCMEANENSMHEMLVFTVHEKQKFETELEYLKRRVNSFKTAFTVCTAESLVPPLPSQEKDSSSYQFSRSLPISSSPSTLSSSFVFPTPPVPVSISTSPQPSSITSMTSRLHSSQSLSSKRRKTAQASSRIVSARPKSARAVSSSNRIGVSLSCAGLGTNGDSRRPERMTVGRGSNTDIKNFSEKSCNNDEFMSPLHSDEDFSTVLVGKESMLPPQQSMLPPQQSMLPPQQSMLPPQQSMLPPQQSMLPPQQSMLPPDVGSSFFSAIIAPTSTSSSSHSSVDVESKYEDVAPDEKRMTNSMVDSTPLDSSSFWISAASTSSEFFHCESDREDSTSVAVIEETGEAAAVFHGMNCEDKGKMSFDRQSSLLSSMNVMSATLIPRTMTMTRLTNSITNASSMMTEEEGEEEETTIGGRDSAIRHKTADDGAEEEQEEEDEEQAGEREKGSSSKREGLLTTTSAPTSSGKLEELEGNREKGGEEGKEGMGGVKTLWEYENMGLSDEQIGAFILSSEYEQSAVLGLLEGCSETLNEKEKLREEYKQLQLDIGRNENLLQRSCSENVHWDAIHGRLIKEVSELQNQLKEAELERCKLEEQLQHNKHNTVENSRKQEHDMRGRCKKLDEMRNEISKLTREKDRICKKKVESESLIKRLESDLTHMKEERTRTIRKLEGQDKLHRNSLQMKEIVIDQLRRREQKQTAEFKKREGSVRLECLTLRRKNEELQRKVSVMMDSQQKRINVSKQKSSAITQTAKVVPNSLAGGSCNSTVILNNNNALSPIHPVAFSSVGVGTSGGSSSLSSSGIVYSFSTSFNYQQQMLAATSSSSPRYVDSSSLPYICFNSSPTSTSLPLMTGSRQISGTQRCGGRITPSKKMRIRSASRGTGPGGGGVGTGKAREDQR